MANKKIRPVKQADNNTPNSGSEQEIQLALQGRNSRPSTPPNRASPHTSSIHADDNNQPSRNKLRKKRKKANKAKKADSNTPNRGSETSEQEIQLALQGRNSRPSTPPNHASPHTSSIHADDNNQPSRNKLRKKRKKANKAKQVDSNTPNSGSETSEQEIQLAQQGLNSRLSTPPNHGSLHTLSAKPTNNTQQTVSSSSTYTFHSTIKEKLSECIETLYDIIWRRLQKPDKKLPNKVLRQQVMAYFKVNKWDQLYEQAGRFTTPNPGTQSETISPTPLFHVSQSENQRAANENIGFFYDLQTIILCCKTATAELEKQEPTSPVLLVNNILKATEITLTNNKLELSKTHRQLLYDFIVFCGNITHRHEPQKLTQYREARLKSGQEESLQKRAALDKQAQTFHPKNIVISTTPIKAPILEPYTYIPNRDTYEKQLQDCLTKLTQMIEFEPGQHYAILRNTLQSPYQLLCINNASDFCSFNKEYKVGDYKTARIHDCGKATEQIGASVIFTHQKAKTKLSCYTRVLEPLSLQQPYSLDLSRSALRNTQISGYIHAVDTVTNEYLSHKEEKKKIPSCIINVGFFTLEKIPPFPVLTVAARDIPSSQREFALITINGQITNESSKEIAQSLQARLQESNASLTVFYLEKNAAPITSRNVRMHCETLFALFIEKLMTQLQQELDQSRDAIFCQEITGHTANFYPALGRSYSAPSPVNFDEDHLIPSIQGTPYHALTLPEQTARTPLTKAEKNSRSATGGASPVSVTQQPNSPTTSTIKLNFFSEGSNPTPTQTQTHPNPENKKEPSTTHKRKKSGKNGS